MILNKFSKIAFASVIAMTMFSTSAMAADTSDVPVDFQVNGGTLDFTIDNSAISFTALELNTLVGADYNDVQPIPGFNIKDARGDDTAWELQASATQFADSAISAVLPADVLSMNNSTLASSENVLGLASTKQVLSSTGIPVVTALGGDGSGMGSFDFTGSTLELDAASVDFAQYKAGSYLANVNFSLVTGP